ncbi:hypothetical protein CHUAL_006555 [Chamberlinius hualienensis]
MNRKSLKSDTGCCNTWQKEARQVRCHYFALTEARHLRNKLHKLQINKMYFANLILKAKMKIKPLHERHRGKSPARYSRLFCYFCHHKWPINMNIDNHDSHLKKKMKSN